MKAYASRIPASSSTYAFSGSATDGWKTSAQTVTITASGGDGAGRTIHYSQDGGATWTTSGAASVDVAVHGEGVHDFRYYCSDSLATEPVHQAGYVNIDTAKPATSDDHLTVPLAGPCTVTLSASDATSGVRKTEYKVDGAAAYTAGTSVVLHAGTHTVAYRSTDNAGNVESDRNFTVTIGDGGSPVSRTGYSAFAADATGGWHTGAETVDVTATAGAGSGLTIHTSQDGGATWQAVAGAAATISVTTEGAHRIAFYASDSSATEATHEPGWVNIDSVAPVTSDDHPASALGPLTVALTPSDATSGMTGGAARTEYKVDDAPAYSSGTSMLLSEGVHTVAYRSTDAAGNRESPDKSFTVTVLAPPTPVSACGHPFAPDASSGWLNTAQQLTIAAAGGSGAERTIHYTLDGGATWSTSTGATVDVPVATEGAHHVQFYASDSLATEDLHDAGWVNVDTVKPWTTAARAVVRRGAKVTLRFRVNDGVPGCGSAAVKLQIRKRAKVVKTIALGTRQAGVALTWRYRARLGRGTYTWRVLATDLAGNASVQMTAARLVVR